MAESALRLSSLLALLFAWQFVVWQWQPEALPGPAAVAGRLLEEVSGGELFTHLSATLGRVALSFAAALLLGSALGLAMAASTRLDALLDMPLTIALNVPALVVIILCFMWLGLTDFAAVLAVTVNKLPTIAIALREGGKAVDRQLLEVARAFGLPPWRRWLRVYMPQLSPYFFAACRAGLALVWKIVLVVELMGCSSGVGFQLGIYFQYFDIEGVLAYTAAFVMIILLLDALVLRRWEAGVGLWRGR